MSKFRTVVPELFRPENSVLIRREDEQFLDEVFTECRRGLLQRHYDSDQGNGGQLANILANVKEGFTEYINALRLDERSAYEFCAGFPSANLSRRNTCQVLNDIGNALHLHRRNSNIARLTSNVVSFVGGATMVASAVISVVTLGAGAAIGVPMGIAGAGMATAGSATAVGTSITETVLSNNAVNEAQTIIDQDREDSQRLNPWIVNSVKLEMALQKIRDIDLVREITETVKNIVEQAMTLRKGEQRSQVIRKLVSEAVTFLPDIGDTIQCASTLISIVVAIILLHERNKLVCDCAALTFRIIVGILSLTDAAIDMGVALGRLAAGGGAVARNVGAAVARGAFGVLSVSLDAAMIIMTSIDIHRGSESAIGRQILDVAARLENQREDLERLYNMLRGQFELRGFRRLN